jgi:cytosine/adenosine deaminase-related metal-dependent hydrolase
MEFVLTLISARFVFPVVGAPIVDGAVVVDGERIVAVGPAAAMRAQYASARERPLGEAVLLPAAVNAHTHLELTALEGVIPEGLDMASWILALVRERRKLDGATLRASAEEGVRRTLASGVAAVGEICSAGQSVGPVVESGLRGVVYYELLNGDPAQAEAVLALGQAQIARWRTEYPGARVRFGLSLHAPYTVSRPLFERTVAWCRDEGVPLCIHAAESPAETRWLLDRSGPIRDTLYAGMGRPADLEPAPGVSPMRYLHELGALREETLLAHGVWVNDDDLALVAESGAVVAHCPRSNTWLLNGRLPWAAYRLAGVRLALGTDSLASSPSLSVWEEAAYAHALHTEAGEAPTSEELLWLATLGGADALGLADELGSLEAGKVAALAWAPLVGALDAGPETAERALAALLSGRIQARTLETGV